jgi:hypothetical protein
LQDKEDIVVDLRLLKGVPIAAKKEKESEPEPPAPLAVAVQPPRRRGHSRAPSIDWTSEAAKTAVGTPTSGPTSANKTTISSMLLGTSHGISLSETQSTANAPAAAAAAASTNVASDWESLFADCIFGSIDQNGVDSIDFEQVCCLSLCFHMSEYSSCFCWLQTGVHRVDQCSARVVGCAHALLF